MKQNIFNFSLRSKLVLTVTFAVIAVSCFLLYFTIKMIILDKQAYIYDSVYQSLTSGNATLEQFFDNKSTFIKVLAPEHKKPQEFTAEQLAADKDHYQSFVIPMNVSREQMKAMPLFKNEKHLEFYKKRETFLDVDERYLFLSAEEAKFKGYLEKLYFQKDKAPRFVILVYNSTEDVVYYFDFLLDKIYSENFDRQSLKNMLVSSTGEALFNNRSYDVANEAEDAVFYRNFIREQLDKSGGESVSGVMELNIHDEEYIWGFQKLDRISYSDFFIFTGVKTAEAYQVTKILVINTLIYTLLLVGSFNLISIYIVKSITKPLEVLTENVKLISEGKYNLTFEKQKTFEYKLLVEAFQEMVAKIESYQNKLIEYNKTLELRVKERTQDLKQANDFIQAMVDSLSQGLIVFDRNGVCLNLHTRASKELVGEDPAGKNLVDLIKHPDRDLFNSWVDNLFEEMIPFESLVELGPKSIPCDKDYKSLEFKHVSLEYFPMRDEDNLIKNVVLVASDNTREFKAFKEVEEQQSFVKLVSKVIKDKNNFLRFNHQFNELFTQQKDVISSQGLENQDDFMRLVHSMKGSAAFYSLQDVVNHLHHFESDLLNGQLEKEDIISRIEESLNRMNQSFDALSDLLGGSAAEVVEIEEAKLISFEEQIRKSNPQLAQLFRDQFIYGEIRNYVEHYITLATDLAFKLNKAINPIVVENGDLRVDREYYQDFFDSCIHVFRNIVDHGIELPETRVERGKSEEGNIKISFNMINNGEQSCLEFNVQDDGGGIDPEKIRNKMRQLNYPEEVISKKDDQVIYHIFDANFSTSDQVTEISGRGVGLYDIKKNIEKLQGGIELQSKIGKGTLFSFLIPVSKK